jgi:branched-chain amino acid transport system permease protein
MTDLKHRLPDKYWALGLLMLLLALLPVFVRSPYLITIMIFIGLYTIVTIGLCLLMGYAGQISLGQAAFYGLGAYTSAIATTKYGLSPWLGLPLSMALTGGVALVIARPIFKLKGNYLAMATLGFGYIIYIIFTDAGSLTGGPSGLTGVPYLSIAGWAFDRDVKYYYLVWGVAAIVLLASLNIINSRVGRALRAVHTSEIAAGSVGVDIDRLKAQVFVISAVYAGLAGSLYAHYLTFVNPSPFGFHFSVMLVVMAAVGGLATVWGAPFGAAAVTLLTEALRAVVPRLLDHASAEYEIIAFGMLLMLVMIFMPQGVVQGLSGIYNRRLKRKPTATRIDSRKLVLLPVLRRWFKLGS